MTIQHSQVQLILIDMTLANENV